MKIVKYTLTPEGTTPEWIDGGIISGGQFPRANDLESPQDWTMIGVANEVPEGVETIDSHADLLAYMQEYLVDSDDPFMPFNVEESAQLIWDKYEASA